MTPERITGIVVEWDDHSGLIQLDDPDSVDDGSDSFVYVGSEDVVVPGSLSVGISVDFRVARDQHGLLAADVQVCWNERSMPSRRVDIPSAPITGKRVLVQRGFCSGTVELWDPTTSCGCIRLDSNLRIADPRFDPQELVPFHELDVDEGIGGLGTLVEFLLFHVDQFGFGAEHVRSLDGQAEGNLAPKLATAVAPKRAAPKKPTKHQNQSRPPASVGHWARILPPRPAIPPPPAPGAAKPRKPLQPRGSLARAIEQEDEPPKEDSELADEPEDAALSEGVTTSSREDAKNFLVFLVPEIMKPHGDLEQDWSFDELCKRIIKYVEKGLAACGPERQPWDHTVKKFLDKSLQSFSAACAEKPWFLHVDSDMKQLFCDVAEKLVPPPSREELEALVDQEYSKITEQRVFEDTIWTALHRAFPNRSENATKKLYTALTRTYAAVSKEAKEKEQGSNMTRIKAFAKKWIQTSMGRAHGMGMAEDLTEPAMLELFRNLVHPEQHEKYSCIPKELLQKTGRPPRNWDFLRPTLREMIGAWQGDSSQPIKRRKRNPEGELEGAPGDAPEDEVPVVKIENVKEEDHSDDAAAVP